MSLDIETLLAGAFSPGPEGFPFPDWEEIAQRLESTYPKSRWDDAWRGAGKLWMQAILECLPEAYQLTESAPFLIIDHRKDGRTQALARILHHADGIVRQSLGRLLPETLYGACPVLAFHDEQTFYRYFSTYVSEDGSFGGAGGVYLNHGYGHFAFPAMELEYYADVVAHELSHAYLSHLGLPLWLDEAITADVEDAVTGRNPYAFDREMAERHQDFWTEEAIAAFWTGHSFLYDDEGQELSYHLARFILRSMQQGGATPRSVIEAFVSEADWKDAGTAAAEKHIGFTPADCIEALLGPGPWQPDPEPGSPDRDAHP